MYIITMKLNFIMGEFMYILAVAIIIIVSSYMYMVTVLVLSRSALTLNIGVGYTEILRVGARETRPLSVTHDHFEPITHSRS